LPNSVRIHSELAQGKFAPSAVLPDKEFPPVEFVAFRVPNGNRLLVILSNANAAIDVIIEENGAGTESIQISLPSRAIATVLWPKAK
jgi:O-glycosyl hydrolase